MSCSIEKKSKNFEKSEKIPKKSEKIGSPVGYFA